MSYILKSDSENNIKSCWFWI